MQQFCAAFSNDWQERSKIRKNHLFIEHNICNEKGLSKTSHFIRAFIADESINNPIISFL